MSVLELRRVLGWTQAKLARETLLSERSIRRIEKGLVRPHPGTHWKLMKLANRCSPQVLEDSVRVYTVSVESMERHLGKASNWSHMTRQQRHIFQRWRAYYRRILAEQSAGRCLIMYRNKYKQEKSG